MATKASESAAEKITITLTFRGDDKSLYDELVQDAKSARRSVSQFVLLYLVDNYKVNTDPSTSE